MHCNGFDYTTYVHSSYSLVSCYIGESDKQVWWWGFALSRIIHMWRFWAQIRKVYISKNMRYICRWYIYHVIIIIIGKEKREQKIKTPPPIIQTYCISKDSVFPSISDHSVSSLCLCLCFCFCLCVCVDRPQHEAFT